MRGSKKKNRRLPQTVRGVVALAEWSDSNDNAEVVILTEDDEEFLIDASHTPIRPARFVNSMVEATGRVYEMDDQLVLELRRMRTIESYRDFDDMMAEPEDGYGFDDDEGLGGWMEDDFDSYARYIRNDGDLSD